MDAGSRGDRPEAQGRGREHRSGHRARRSAVVTQTKRRQKLAFGDPAAEAMTDKWPSVECCGDWTRAGAFAVGGVIASPRNRVRAVGRSRARRLR